MLIIIYLVILEVFPELLLDSQDSQLQIISQEKLQRSFSIWFKFLQTFDRFEIVSFYEGDNEIIYPFIEYIQQDLRFCLFDNDCTSLSNMQKYQNAQQWIHIIISQNIRIDYPIQLIVLNKSINQDQQLVLRKSQHYRCLIYDRVQKVEKRIQIFSYEKLVRPPEILELFTQQSIFQIFLRQIQNNQCDENEELLKITHKNLLNIQLTDANNVQFKINDDFIDNIPHKDLKQWFQIQLIIDYQIIKFLLIVESYTYTKEFEILFGKDTPLYFNLAINLQANNFDFQSSIYYQFYDQNEIINSCHSYCKECNHLTCVSCYVDNCECQPNQFFNTTTKMCQFYSQLSYIQIIQLPKICQRGYMINLITNQCEISHLRYEGEMDQQSKVGDDSNDIQFQIIEDLIFRKNFLDSQQNNKTSSLLFDYPSNYSFQVFEILKDSSVLIIKVKELFIIYKFMDGFQLCRHQYFGNRCQFKIQNCLSAKNQKCLHCQPNYILIKSQCYKCPLNCLICNFIKNKINCIFASEGYYINQYNLLQKCQNCDMCNQSGCITQTQVINQIHYCEQNKLCYKDVAITCHDRDKFIIDLSQQQCQQFSHIQLQLLQSLLFTKEKYLGQYEIPFIQQIILNSINSNNTDIFYNEQVSHIYRFEQLRYQYLKKLNENFSDKETRFLRQNGYICKQEYLYNNSIYCIKYDYDPNLSEPCQSNQTCKYNLTLNNVLIHMGNQNAIYYENQEYDSLDDLLLAIYDIGFDFRQITINATFILNNFYKDEEYSSESLLYINKKLLPYNLENCQFILHLYYQSYGEDISQNIYLISIKSDYIFLYNFIVHFNLYLNVESYQFIMNNTQAHNSTFKLITQEAKQIAILNTLIGNIDSNKFFQFLIKGKPVSLFISEFRILNSILYQGLFEVEEIETIKLDKIRFYDSKFIDAVVFRFIYVNILQVIDLSCDTIELIYSQLFLIDLSHEIMISIVNFNQIYSYGSYPLFMNQQAYQVSIENFSINNSTLFIPSVFLIQAHDKLMMENIYLILNAKLIIQFRGDTLIINKLQIHQQGAQPIRVILSGSNKVLINSIEYIQKNHTLIQYRADYLIYIISEKNSLINNIKFSNLALSNFGILYVESRQFIQFHNITINTCEFIQQQQVLNLISINSQGRSLLQNFNITNVLIINEIFNQPSIFSLNGTNDICYMKNIFIHNINVSVVANTIFLFANKRLQIVGVSILNTIKLRFFQLQSYDIQISKIKFINNVDQQEMFVVGYKSNYQMSFMTIKNLFVYNSTGTLISDIDQYYGSFYIQFDDVEIKLVNYYPVVSIMMRDTVLKINNLSIQDQGQIISFQEKILFMILHTRLYLYDIELKNLRARFGYISHPQKIEIKRMIIQNVTLLNFVEQSQSFIQMLISKTMVFSDITIINSKFTHVSFIFALIFQGTLILQNFKILDIDSNCDLIEFNFFNQSNSARLNNFFIQNLKIESLITSQSELEHSLIFLDDSYVGNSLQKIFDTNETMSIKINNSLFINSHSIFSTEQKISLILQGSQIINHKQKTFQQIKIQKSLIFDEGQSSFTVAKIFTINLSFNLGESLPSTRRLTQNVNQIVFDNRNTSFFYLPSGQIINKYERLDLKKQTYQQIYQGFSIVAQGLFNSNISCNITSTYKGEVVRVFNYQHIVLKQGLNQIEDLTSIINPYNSDYVQNDIQCENYTLRFNTKAFRCQLGEYIFQNQCLQCDIQKGLYSTLYNSTHCYNVNYNQIEQLKIGLIKLRKDYWRYNYSTIFIEQCNNQQHCTGGWTTGDHSCNSSRIGALCQECDIYNRMGNGHYTKNINTCQLCDVNYTLIYQIIFSIVWQLLLTFVNIYTKDSLSKQFLFYKVGFSNFYQVLYRLSIDQPSVMLKMFLNYLFQIYLIRDNFDTLGQLLVLNINYMNNPNLIMQAQLDCLFIQVQNVDIIYTQFFFTLCNLFFILNLQYFIYLVIVKFRVTAFSIKFFFLTTAETLIFNLKIILEVSFKLLTNQDISRIKWVTSNISYEYYTPNHLGWLKNYIIPITCIIVLTPVLIIFLLKLNANIYRKVKKTFSLFQQAYKNNYFFWEYVLIYSKLLFILIAIINREQLQLTTFLCIGLLTIIYNQQPYYLKNLNHAEIKLLLCLLIVIQFLLLTNNGFVQSIIFIMNIYIAFDILKLVINKQVQLNRQTVFDYKLLITNKFPKLRKISGLEKDQQTISNQRLMRQVIRKKYLSRKNSQVTTKSFISKPETVSLQNEIELATFKSASSI